jgi:hypothetical protein
MNFGFCKKLGIPWLYKRLIAEKELCFMQLDKMDHTSFQRFMPFWTIVILRHKQFLPLPGLLWHISSYRIRAASLLRFLNLPWTIHQLVQEVAAYTTHNLFKRGTSMPSTGCEPAITTIEQTATGIGPFLVTYLLYILFCEIKNAEACYIIAKWSSNGILKTDEG